MKAKNILKTAKEKNNQNSGLKEMKFSKPTKFEIITETFYDFPSDVTFDVENKSNEIPGLRHCVKQFSDKMEDEDHKLLLQKLAEDIPSIKFQKIFKIGVQYGWREIAHQISSRDEFDDEIKLVKLKALLHAKKPTHYQWELPTFNTERCNSGKVLVLDSSTKFTAKSKANLKYKTKISLNDRQEWEKELISEDFDVTITANKLCFELAHQPAQQPALHPRPQTAQQPSQQISVESSQQPAHHMKCGMCVQLMNISVFLPSLGSIGYGIYLILNSTSKDDELGNALITVGTYCLFTSVVGLFGACPCIDIFILRVRLLKIYFYLLVIGFIAFIGYGSSFHNLINTKRKNF